MKEKEDKDATTKKSEIVEIASFVKFFRPTRSQGERNQKAQSLEIFKKVITKHRSKGV